jgi:hypothetical protein
MLYDAALAMVLVVGKLLTKNEARRIAANCQAIYGRMPGARHLPPRR